MFITTQHGHTIASDAYRQPHIRTGMEAVIAKRVGKMFAVAALEDGVVTSVTDKALRVKYASGKEVGYPLGRIYGRAEGTTYPHDLIANKTVGQKFKMDDILTYNQKFFEPDFLDPTTLVMKTNAPVRTAFIESNVTHEDSCSFSARMGQQLTTEVTKVKSFIVNFGQNLSHIAKIGAEVAPSDILMLIEDEITAATGQYSEASLEVLKRLSHSAPKAKVRGILEKIEVFYHGDKQDMSPTLRRLVERSDAEIAKTAKDLGEPIVTGRVTEEYRVSGTPLELDKAEVRFYLTVRAGTGSGDKAVFGHQMKCTTAEIQRTSIFTEKGDEVDAIFSHRSVAARGALSPMLLCVYTTLLDELGKRVVKAYFGEKP